MASIDNKGRIRGTAGSVVYRMYREKNIVQGKPGKIKQTKGSVRASTEFGLSSSAAAMIRRAFEPAYIHRDGEAVSRSTRQVYRSLRNSPTGSAGQRDLHDAHLQDLVGMDFNGSSKLSEVLQISHRVNRDAEGNLDVSLGRFNPREDVRSIAGAPQKASRYRIRLMVVAFDFRQEYLEYLDIQDLDVQRTKVMEEQTIRLNAQADPGCMVMLSMSLLMYDEVAHTAEYVLLNNKSFSPCAIIAAYQSTVPSVNTVNPLAISIGAYPERYKKMREMGYEGNRLLKQLAKRIPNLESREQRMDRKPIDDPKATSPTTQPTISLGVKSSFRVN